MPHTLDTIPVELLNAVFEFLAEEVPGPSTYMYTARLKNFHALCHTSRGLHAAATPFLYAKFHSENRAQGLWPLLETLAERPELTKHLQCIIATPTRMKRASALPSDKPKAVARVFGKGAAASDVITRALQSGCHTAALVYLLYKATNVRRLVLNLRPQPQTKDSVLPNGTELCSCCPDMARALQTIFSFRAVVATHDKLTELHLISEGYMIRLTGEYQESMSRLLNSPALQSLTCKGFSSFPKRSPWLCTPGSSGVTKLGLSRGYLTTEDIEGILVACAALRHLSIDWYRDYSVEEDYWPLHVPIIEQRRLVDVIHSHAPRLASLCLIDSLQDGDYVFGAVGVSFAPLSELVQLDVDEELLVGYNDIGPGTRQWKRASLHLPPTLAKLTINLSAIFEASDDIRAINAVLTAVCNAQSETLQELVVSCAIPEDVNKNHEWDFRRTAVLTIPDTDAEACEYGQVVLSLHREHESLTFCAKGDPGWMASGILAKQIVGEDGLPHLVTQFTKAVEEHADHTNGEQATDVS